MKFEQININDLKPAPYNPRIMPQAEQNKLENNLKTFGLVDPIIIDLTDNNTVIGGHQRLEALKNINDEQELHLLKLGDIGLVFKELDFKIKDKNDQKALNLSLNKIQGDWDYGLLDDLLIELGEAHYDIELTGFDEIELIQSEIGLDDNFFEENSIPKQNNPYTQEIKAPLYTPLNETAPQLNELYNIEHMKKLQEKIKLLPPETSPNIIKFLMETSHRFVEYNYSNIAEFYCHQNKEVQEIMEELVLIIIDFNKAIEKGFVEINEKYIQSIPNEREV